MSSDSDVKSMAHLKDLLGNEILNGDTLTFYKTDQLKGKTLGLLFSASWCDRCKKLTTKLNEVYHEALKENQLSSFDVVLVSLDDDEELFNESYQQMPWKALPFSDADEVSEALMEKYKIDDIPSLVILNPDGDVLTFSGNEELEKEINAIALWIHGKTVFWAPDNSDGNEYVWKNISCHLCYMKPLMGERFHCANQQCGFDFCEKCFEKGVHDHALFPYLIPTNSYSVDQLFEDSHFIMRGDQVHPLKSTKGKYLGIYFSASWAPSNDDFTGKLAQVYQNAMAVGLPFDTIFISADDDLARFQQHVRSMPWKVIVSDDQRTTLRLKGYYQVEDLPALIIINPNGELVTRFGHRDINQKRIEAVRIWCKGETVAYTDDDFVWSSVMCDGCGMAPLIGQRFHCSVCTDYDLCQGCSREGHEHQLNLVATPSKE